MNFIGICVILLAGLQISSAKIQIWKVDQKSFELIPIDESELTGLKSNEAYVVLQEKPESATDHVIYYWVGKDTPQRIAGLAGSHAVELDTQKNTNTAHTIPMFLRIRREVEGEESLNFRKLFIESFNIAPSATEMETDSEAISASNKEQKFSPPMEIVDGQRFTSIFYKGGAKARDNIIIWKIFPVVTDNLDQGECLLIDSKGPSGTFVWMGREADLVIRKEAAVIAEKYIREEKSDYKTPITFYDSTDLPPNVRSYEDLYKRLRRPLMEK